MVCVEGSGHSEHWAMETQGKVPQRDTPGPTLRNPRAGPGLFGQESEVFQVVVAQAASGVRILPFGEGGRRGETAGTEGQGQRETECLEFPREFRRIQ